MVPSGLMSIPRSWTIGDNVFLTFSDFVFELKPDCNEKEKITAIQRIIIMVNLRFILTSFVPATGRII